MSIKALVTSCNQLLFSFIEDGHYEDFQQVLPRFSLYTGLVVRSVRKIAKSDF
jgi:hypothetical protein